MAETEDAVATEEEENEEKEIDLAPVQKILDALPEKNRNHLIPVLQRIQDVYRYLPPTAMAMLIDELGVTRAQLYGVISFYPKFLIEEPGKYIIKLCYGTACFVKGADLIASKLNDCYHMKPGQTDPTKLFTLQTASCLGNCGAAPMAIVGDDTHGTIDPEKTLALFGEYKL
ncbi:MAG: NAD(P)H-dependent oxidoreductase subunit E [Candidatus Nitrohelix vancouverensis]|uniref:NAD(P)H-dependent oxidoreductase subunit E n=1 Tax=Candidatus Nitrohelix vancouverensis TaxID=2705534 RepID=A0A7T0C2Y1_9BACT|nr:MAG: NAD(P)H-dependent oxidoreductase subunit E [Candidatus Nitrohelix vancouverensis]